jgi:hypothetical protein
MNSKISSDFSDNSGDNGETITVLSEKDFSEIRDGNIVFERIGTIGIGIVRLSGFAEGECQRSYHVT